MKQKDKTWILKRKNIDYQKEFKYSFGSYIIASQENSPKKKNHMPQSYDCIYLWASKAIQSNHRVLNISTGKVIERLKVMSLPITDIVIAAVNSMAKEQGLKGHKFYNCKRELLTPVDLLEGVSNQINERALVKIY